MLGGRRIQLLAVVGIGAVLATMVARALPFLEEGWSADVVAASVIGEPPLLVLVAFAAVVVASAGAGRSGSTRAARAGVIVAAGVQVPAALWVAWRVAVPPEEGGFITRSWLDYVSTYLVLGAIVLVLAAAAVTALRPARMSRPADVAGRS